MLAVGWGLKHCLRQHQACGAAVAGAIRGLMAGGTIMGKKVSIKDYVRVRKT